MKYTGSVQLSVRPTRTLIVGTPIVLVIAAIYVFGAYAAGAGMAYPQRFTLPEAVRAAWRTPTSRMLRDYPGSLPMILFVPGVLLGWAGYCAARRRRGLRRVVLIGVAVVPLAFAGPMAVLAPLLALMTPLLLAADGEFYSEGFASMIAVGWWVYFMLAVVCLEAVRPQTVPGVCTECGYSLSGLASRVCPECGSQIRGPSARD